MGITALGRDIVLEQIAQYSSIGLLGTVIGTHGGAVIAAFGVCTGKVPLTPQRRVQRKRFLRRNQANGPPGGGVIVDERAIFPAVDVPPGVVLPTGIGVDEVGGDRQVKYHMAVPADTEALDLSGLLNGNRGERIGKGVVRVVGHILVQAGRSRAGPP